MKGLAWVLVAAGVGFVCTQCVQGAELDVPPSGSGGSAAAEAGVPEAGDPAGAGGTGAVTGGAGSGGTGAAPAGGGAPSAGGGTPSVGGSGGTPGTGATPATGGVPTTGGVPSTGGGSAGTIPVDSVKAEVSNQTTADACTASGSTLQLTFKITVSAWITSLAGVTVEYWYTPEITNPVVEIYHSTARDFTEVVALSDHVEIQFTGGTGPVSGSATYEIQTALHAADYGQTSDPSNDYSCGDPSKITVHHNGQLISGTPPG